MNRKEVLRYFIDAADLSFKYKLSFNLKGLDTDCTGCNTPWTTAYVDVYGDIYPCCMMGAIKGKAVEYFKDAPLNLDFSSMNMGNVDENILDIWNSNGYWEFRNECAVYFNEQTALNKKQRINMEEYVQFRKENKDCKNYCKVCGLRFGMVC
jgi:hypothetical protein